VCVDIVIEDYARRYPPAQTLFSFQTEASAVDRFIERLRVIEDRRRKLVLVLHEMESGRSLLASIAILRARFGRDRQM